MCIYELPSKLYVFALLKETGIAEHSVQECTKVVYQSFDLFDRTSYIYICVCVRMYVCMYVRTYVRTYVRMYVM